MDSNQQKFTEQEIQTLRADFELFCEIILRIKLKKEVTREQGKGGLAPFKFNKAQKIVWSAMKKQLKSGQGIHLIVLKSRQMGMSTLFVAWAFWNMWRRGLTNCTLISHKKDTAESLIQTCNKFYQNMPDQLRPKLRDESKKKLNRNEIYFSSLNDYVLNSSMNTAVSTADVGRGESLDIVIATEVGAYKDPSTLFEGLISTLNENPIKTVIYESTPRDGWYRTKYNAAKDGKAGGCIAVYLPWFILTDLYSVPYELTPVPKKKWFWKTPWGELVTFDDDERAEWHNLNKQALKMGFPELTAESMYWRQLKIQEYDGDIEVFRQEYISSDTECFQRSTQSAFRSSIPMAEATVDLVDEECPDLQIGTLESDDYYGLTKTTHVNFQPQIKNGYINFEDRYGMIMFKPPVPGYTYTIGCDVADELENMDDLDNESAYSVACVYCCNTLEQVAEWRGKLSPFDFGDEICKLGYFYNTALVNIELNNMGHETIARVSRNLNYPMQAKYIEWDSDTGKPHKDKKHFFTNTESKQLLIGGFNQAVRSRLWVVRSEFLLMEMMSYIAKDGKYKCSDLPSDRIIAAALSWAAAMQTDLAYHRDIILGARADTKAFPDDTKKESAPKESLAEQMAYGMAAGEYKMMDDLWEMSDML